jgi:RNase P/RNase MRP subunit p29
MTAAEGAKGPGDLRQAKAAEPSPLEREELIGRHARVVAATSKTYEGVEGLIVDETREMIRLRTPKGEPWLPKRSITLEIQGQRLEGSEIRFRPEDRIKKVRSKRPAGREGRD